MAIVSNNIFLRSAIYSACTLGIWPFVIYNSLLNKVLNIYSIFIHGYLVAFCTISIIKLYKIIQTDEFSSIDVFNIISVCLIYAIQIGRSIRLQNPKIEKLCNRIFTLETKIYSGNNENIIKIYENSIGYLKWICLVFLINALFAALLFSTKPFVDGGPEKTLQFLAWYPFDEQKYFYAAYVSQCVVSLFGIFLIIGSDIIAFSFTVFPTSQLKILNYILSNFNEFKGGNAFGTIRECILYQKEIIAYVEDFNVMFSMMMLIDFLQSSFQMAALILQIVFKTSYGVEDVSLVSFLALMILRLYFYYWNGNELTSESQRISDAIWESNWSQETLQVKKCMLLMMKRAQRRLLIHVGPFFTMDINTMIAILKATYSYVMLITSRK